MVDTDAQIVESPITEAKVVAAMDAARAAVGLSGPIAITNLSQGRGILVTSNTIA